MTNQTDQKDKNNRDKMTEEELKTALRPIWQGVRLALETPCCLISSS